jgi:TRAP transporter TAXI family solute receptor
MMTRKYVRHHFTIRLMMSIAATYAFFITALTPISASAFDILLGTGPEGTFSHFTGRSICRIISRHAEDVDCKTVPGPDAIDNLTNLQGGSLDISLVDSLLLTDAINKTGYFKFLDIRYDNLRELLPLYDQPVTLVVRSDADITSLEKLKGKRINAGAPRSEERLATDMILTANNWTRDDFSLFGELSASQSQDTMAFCYGEIQAMLHIGVHPDPSVQQLLALCNAALVDMDDNNIAKMVDSQPALSQIDIPAGIYPSLQKPVATFGTTVSLIASASLDEQTAYKIMEALNNNQQNLKSAHAALSGFTVGPAPDRTTGIQIHPGADRYLSTHGN